MTITVSTENPRSCKALALLEGADTWLKIRRKSDGAKFYVIPGSAGHVYWTNCGECSCPDNQHRGVECKHITAVKLYCREGPGGAASAPLPPPAPTLSRSPARAATTTTGPTPSGSRLTLTHAGTWRRRGHLRCCALGSAA